MGWGLLGPGTRVGWDRGGGMGWDHREWGERKPWDEHEREGGGMTRSLDSLTAAQVAKLKHTIVALSEPWVVSLHRIPHLVKTHRRNDLMRGEMCDDYVTLVCLLLLAIDSAPAPA